MSTDIDTGHQNRTGCQNLKPISSPIYLSTIISLSDSTVLIFSGLPQKDFLRPDEVAQYFSVHINTIYRWIDSGKLEGRKIAGTILRIPRESVIRICEEST